MLEVNSANFKDEISKRNLVLVDFYATWCGPCSMQSEVLNRIYNSRSLNFDILKVNVDESQELTNEYGIQSIPTLIIFKNNKLVRKIVGYTDEEEILKLLEHFE